MRYFKTCLATFGTALFAAFLTFSAPPALAQGKPGNQGNVPGYQGSTGSKAVPGPVVGTGLLGLTVVGGYLLWQRRRNRAKN